MDFVIILAVLALVVLLVSGPLRRPEVRADAGAGADAGGEDPGPQLAELEAAREAKYREIRDAELDHRTGKLSDADYEAIDGALRGEAIEILRALDRAKEQGAAQAPARAPVA
jgi:hypothetical protein